MNHIYKGIHLSGREVLKNMNLVYKMGIRAVVRLDHMRQHLGDNQQWSDAFELLYLPINDGEGITGEIFAQVTGFIHQQIQRDRQVLVHCQMGISRSATMVLAYLVEYEGMSLGRAYAQVVRHRPMIYPHPALLRSLVDYYQLPYEPDRVASLYFRDHLLAEARV
jgi:protein-tyrosine phosphatase